MASFLVSPPCSSTHKQSTTQQQQHDELPPSVSQQDHEPMNDEKLNLKIKNMVKCIDGLSAEDRLKCFKNVLNEINSIKRERMRRERMRRESNQCIIPPEFMHNNQYDEKNEVENIEHFQS